MTAPRSAIPRRAFLDLAGRVVVGSFLIYGAPGAVLSRLGGPETPSKDTPPPEYDPQAHEWIFIVDTLKCIGCGRCVRACKEENAVPMNPKYNRTWVERYVQTDEGHVHGDYVDSPDAGINGFASPEVNEKYEDRKITKSFFVPKLCNQCEKPPCVQVCPVSATFKTDDGIILVNRGKCIGCRYCIQACPYGARYLDPYEHVADKCTWCYHRISRGLLPACVTVCPVGARKFGDLRDPESEVSRIVHELRLYVLKEEMGTKPRVHYTQLDEGVR